MTEIIYRGEPLTIERFKELLLKEMRDKGCDPSQPISTNKVGREFGLYRPIRLLADAQFNKSREAVLRAAGFTVFSDNLKEKTSEETLRKRLSDYIGKKKVVRARSIFKDTKNGGKKLFKSLQLFGKKKFGQGYTVAQVLQYFGYDSEGRWTIEKIHKMLRAYWPIQSVREAYRGNTALPRISNLMTLNPHLYDVMKRTGTVEVVNSLYQAFPDLYTHVSVRRSSSAANPEWVKKQLMQKFFAGRLISSGLKLSPIKSDRVLYSRVLSLAPILFPQQTLTDEEASYTEIVQKLTGLKHYDISGNAAGIVKRNGAIGNLITEWMLKWMAIIDPKGLSLGTKFRTTFTVVYDVFPERNLENGSEVVRPDIFVMGEKHIGVEVKTGETLRGPNSLVTKYSDSQVYTWNLDGAEFTLDKLIAILHMPMDITRQIDTNLADAGYTVINRDMYASWLERFVTFLEVPPWNEHFAEAAPRLHNARSILGFYETFTKNPAAVTRASRSEELEHIKHSLESLASYDLKATA